MNFHIPLSHMPVRIELHTGYNLPFGHCTQQTNHVKTIQKNMERQLTSSLKVQYYGVKLVEHHKVTKAKIENLKKQNLSSN